MPNTIYVFGAGASHAYDQSPTSVLPPLAKDFFQAYSQLEISADFEVRVGAVVNYVRDIFGIPQEDFGNFDQNIEQFMTQLDLQTRFLATKMAEGERRFSCPPSRTASGESPGRPALAANRGIQLARHRFLKHRLGRRQWGRRR